MSALFLELARSVLFLSSSPLTYHHAPHGEVAKALPVVRLATHKLVYVDDVVGLELLATTLAEKHTVLPKFAWLRHWQKLENLVTYITGMSPLSLLCFSSPH